jgi:beta-N-acetylhexosaminidase
MFDLAGTTLTAAERERLLNPLTGGVILFDRNYESLGQLEALTNEIHGLRDPQLLIAVDQEGGRVQRFRKDFTCLPPARDLGTLYDKDREHAKQLAETCGWVMATELRSVGVDFSFAPVLDLDRDISTVIGDRAFHRDPDVVADLAHAYMNGMKRAGMAATGKHFPGHGGVEGDSHLILPVDGRDYADIYNEDILTFERMIHYGLAAVMAAHVTYPQVDSRPAGFSVVWIKDILRKRLQFQGAVFSDDLSMAGADVGGSASDRARAALGAGCDMVIICNDTQATDEILAKLESHDEPAPHLRLARMHGHGRIGRHELLADSRYQQACERVLSVA